MDNRIKIARQLVRIARELVANELVILPYDGESLRIDEPVRVVNADDSNIGNKTDRSFPYEIWAIDVRGSLVNAPYAMRVERLIRSIQGNPLKKWILWTSDVKLNAIVEFCESHGFKPDAVNDNIHEVKDYYNANSRKVYAQGQVVYAIDFDGTIAETDRTFPQIEKPIDRIVDFIRKIQEDPNKKWVLYTCRVGEPEKIAERWCHENGLFPDAVNSNARRHGDRKVDADYYIDDRNVDLSRM